MSQVTRKPRRIAAGDDPGGSPRKIKVVSSQHTFSDIVTMSLDELRSVLEPLAEEWPPDELQALSSFERLGREVRALRASDPSGGGALAGPQTAAPPRDRMREVALRQLFNSDAAWPIVKSLPVAPDPASIVVRAGKPKEVFAPDPRPGRKGKNWLASAAAEQPLEVTGVAAVPRLEGSAVLEVVSGGLALDPSVSGSALPPAALSVALARRDPSRSPLPHGPRIIPYEPEAALRLARSLGAALAFHLSAAGAELALSRRKGGEAPPAADIKKSIVRAQSRGVVLPTRDVLESLVAKLAEVSPAVTASPDSFVFALSPLMGIFQVGAFGAYQKALLDGLDSPDVENFLRRVGYEEAERAALESLERLRFEEVAKARHYMIIVGERLGPRRSAEIAAELALGGAAAADSPSALLARLKPREREIVTTEYENRQAEWAAQSANKCPHVRLVSLLRAAPTAAKSAKLLAELREYFRPRKGNKVEWILCRSCGFRVLCAHVVELTTLRGKKTPYDKLRSRLAKYSLRLPGGELRGGDSFAYFCKVCSEQLSEFTGEDRTAEVMGAVGELDGSLRRLVWTEAITAVDLVRFPSPVDSRRFAGTAADVCHPLVSLAEGESLRRGRRRKRSPRDGDAADDPYGEEEEVDPRTNLSAIIFVYAYVLNLIRSSRAGSAPEQRWVGFEGVRPGAKVSVYAEAVLNTILKRAGAIISRLEDITPEYVADKFKEAFRRIIGVEGIQVLTHADEATVIVNEVVALSPPYYYAATAARAFGDLPVERALGPKSAKREFETVLGRPLPDILADLAASSDSELVQRLFGIRPGRSGRKKVAEYPSGVDPVHAYGQTEVNFLSELYRPDPKTAKAISTKPFDGMATARFAACGWGCVGEVVGSGPRARAPSIRDYVVVGGRAAGPKKKRPAPPAKKKRAPPKKRAADKRPKLSFLRRDPALAGIERGLYLRSYELFAEYTTKVTSAESMDRYVGRLKKARDCERAYLLERISRATKNYQSFGFTDSRRFRVDSPSVPLSYLYDESGKIHTWAAAKGESVYVYSGEPSLEMTRRDVVNALKKGGTNPFGEREIVDIVCGVCQTRLSGVGDLDEAKVRESLQALSEFAGFYAFYDSRCPAGGLHEFSSGGAPCAKCGVKESLISGYGLDENSKAARAYYEKFTEAYLEQRGVATSPAPARAPPPEKADGKAAARFAEKWKYDYGVVVKAAEMANIPVAALESIGATEGRDYPDVLSGEGAPPPPDTADDPRILAADAAVRSFLTAYNRLRNVSSFSKVPPETGAVLEKVGVPVHDYERLSDLLPDVFDDYAARRLAILRSRPPSDVMAFSVESLARMARDASKVGSTPGWLPALGKEVAVRALADIATSERLFAKNTPFNFKIFGEDDESGAGDMDSGTFGTSGEDVLEDIISQGGEDGAPDAYELQAVDIDGATAAANLEP